jgi:hypothetical protein
MLAVDLEETILVLRGYLCDLESLTEGTLARLLGYNEFVVLAGMLIRSQ